MRVARVPGASSLFVIDRKIFQGLGKEGAHECGDPAHPPGLSRDAGKRAIAAERARDRGDLRAGHYFAWTWLGIRHVRDPHRAALADPAYVPPIPIEDLGTRDVFVNMGDFWWFPGQVQAIDRLKARHGFTVVQECNPRPVPARHDGMGAAGVQEVKLLLERPRLAVVVPSGDGS